MPKVGKKHFPYTPGGVARAKAAAKKEGKKVVMAPGMGARKRRPKQMPSVY